jgi:hypothetical protein
MDIEKKRTFARTLESEKKMQRQYKEEIPAKPEQPLSQAA